MIIPILARPFSISSLDHLDRQLDVVATRAQKDLQEWADGFDNVMPLFEIEVAPGQRTVLPLRNYDGEIVSYVMSGTSVRYATMTPDFEAQTKPGSLSVGRKKGGVAYVRTDDPKPGIRARETHQLMADKYGPMLQNAVSKALNNL